MKELQKIVDVLLDKATMADDSADALRFSQAALNAANTKHALDHKRRSTAHPTTAIASPGDPATQERT